MNNPWDEMESTLRQAREIQSAARDHANRMARMLNESDVLRGVSSYELKRLKLALRKFNMTTGKWSK